MLQRYVECGYLESIPAKNEVYITNAALHNISGDVKLIDALKEIMDRGDSKTERLKTLQANWRKLQPVYRLLRGWCLWLKANKEGFAQYLAAAESEEKDGTLANEQNEKAIIRKCHDIVKRIRHEVVAIHVVGDDSPHPIINTILVSEVRRWWWPLNRRLKVEVIEY